MTDTTRTAPQVDEDSFVEDGQQISTTDDLRGYVSDIRYAIGHMQSGLARAAHGALTGRPWIDTPGDDRRNLPDMIRDLDMTSTPAGLAAKDAVYRQSLATLLTALDAVDRAALTVWLADVNVKVPNRPA